MIYLLFTVLVVEGIVAMLLLVKIGPFRELTVKVLDQLKTGRGPATLITLASTMSMILLSSILSIFKINNRGLKIGTLTPMDQVLWRTHLLEASLMGYSLFLGFIIYRLHHYLRKLISCRMSLVTCKVEAKKIQEERRLLKEKEEKTSEEIRVLKAEISSLSEKLQKLVSESDEKEKRALDAEAHVTALQKQSEDLLLEYDRLLEDNQNLQSQSLGFRA